MGKVTSMTRKGQVTIPKEVRDQLGLKPFDKIEIYVEHGETKLRKAYPALREIAGGLPAINVPWDEMRRIAQEEMADRFGEESR